MEFIELPIIGLHQNIGDLYIGVMKARDLHAIAETDRIRLEKLEIPKYAGYQRALLQERVKSIRDYLDTPRSTFPNAIILSLDSEYIESWEENQKENGISILKIQREKGAVQIIDGQHRAAALNKAPDDFQVIVSIFVDPEMVRRAEIFAKINSTQKAVNPSIAFQLFGYSKDRSPQKSAHEIAETLNTSEGSPFYKRLRMLGTRDAWASGTLSQATFCKELMRLYSRDPNMDENRLLRHQKLEKYPGYPLRDYFETEQDEKILEVLWGYFFNIAKTWPDQWNDQTGESILVKTTGYIAFMRVLREWLKSTRSREIVNNQGVREAFEHIREKYTQKNKRFIRAVYASGNQGVIELRDDLLADLQLRR